MTEFERRWLPARNMWDEGVSRGDIARFYGVTEKALATRIARWRRRFGWFPPRLNNVIQSELSLRYSEAARDFLRDMLGMPRTT